jgi:cytoskeletal protein CcmA (bactofilin family)
MKWSVTAGILVISLLIAMPTDTGAEDQDQRMGNGRLRKHVIVRAGQVINRDYFAFGEIVEISGTVNGDVYAAGAHVMVDGTVNGDLLAAGGTVTISGIVAHDARVAGGQVTISGQIGGNMTVGSGHVEVMPSAVIRGSAVAGGGHVELAGPVERDVKIGAGTVIVSNRIGGNMTAAAGTIRLTSKAVVAGNLIYWTYNFVSIDDPASVLGKTIRREIPEDITGLVRNLLAVFAGLKLAVTAASFVSTLILALLLFRYYPTSTQQALAHLAEEPFTSFGLGMLALILIPLIAGLLAVTVIGLPLMVILLAWSLIALYLSRIFVIAFASQRIFRWMGVGDGWTFFFGLLLYSLLTLVPILGPVVTVLAIVFGLGAVLLAKKEIYQAARAEGLT